ncbi:MAG: thermonuclease family protein [Pseudomonadota bacterium]|nr:thermonuclease family protein [Pseudomonadota bacterium]
MLVVSSLDRLSRRGSKKALHPGAFFVCLFWLLASAAVWAQCPLLPGGFHAEVAQVYDGDTVRLSSGERVRLIGIDTPEIGRDGRADQPGARAAGRWLEQRVQGQQVYLLPGVERRDRYGRLLAHLYWRDELVAEQMLRQGLGFALALGANTRLADCLFSAENAARGAAAGVWRDAPRAARALDKPGFAVVSGRISRITPTRSGRYLDLDDHLALFLPAALAERQLRVGQRVEARGWVQDRLQRQSRLRRGQQRWLLRITTKRHLRLE